jgi:hypothetical protein
MIVEQPPLVSGAGPRPFRTRDDVLAQLDDLLKGNSDTLAPIRDALVDALTALLFQLQFRSEYAIAQADLLRATEQYLTSVGGDDRMVPQAPGEGDEAYRARLLATPSTVTEEAITLGVNIILAPFTTTQCQLIDNILDRWYVSTGLPDAGFHSFIGAPPEYPDRLYSGQEASNGGVSRANSDPGGARVFQSDNIRQGRAFTLLLPDLSELTTPSTVATDIQPPTPHGGSPDLTEFTDRASYGFYVGNTTNPDIVAIVNRDSTTAQAIYQSIESFVNSVVGQSIRWGFIADQRA